MLIPRLSFPHLPSLVYISGNAKAVVYMGALAAVETADPNPDY